MVCEILSPTHCPSVTRILGDQDSRLSPGFFGPQPFGTDEAIDVHTALRSYTIWAARQIFEEKNTGSLEPGKWADLAVWDRNPYTVPTASLKDMQCLMTFYKGSVVFEHQGARITPGKRRRVSVSPALRPDQNSCTLADFLVLIMESAQLAQSANQLPMQKGL
jgi:hypothetical protein